MTHEAERPMHAAAANGRIWRRAAVAVALACLGVPFAACEARLALGAPCVLASDCPVPLSCLAGRCRSA